VLELLIVAGQVRKFLDQHSVPVAYQTVGQFATSLDWRDFLSQSLSWIMSWSRY